MSKLLIEKKRIVYNTNTVIQQQPTTIESKYYILLNNVCNFANVQRQSLIRAIKSFKIEKKRNHSQCFFPLLLISPMDWRQKLERNRLNCLLECFFIVVQQLQTEHILDIIVCYVCLCLCFFLDKRWMLKLFEFIFKQFMLSHTISIEI